MKCDDPTCECHDGKLSLDKIIEVTSRLSSTFGSANKSIKQLAWAFRSIHFTLSCELDKYQFKEGLEIPLTPFDRKAKRIQPITIMVRNIKNIPVLDFYERNAIRILKRLQGE